MVIPGSDGPFFGLDQCQQVIPIQRAVDPLPIQEEPLQDLPGLGNTIGLIICHLQVMPLFKQFIQGSEQGTGDFVADRQRLKAIQAGILQPTDLPCGRTVDQNTAVFVDNPPVQRMAVHHINPDPFLLVAVNLVAGRQLHQAGKVIIRDFFRSEVERLKQITVGLVARLD